ncbi:hypothetical protein OQX63_05970 [Pedobacter sp. PF22-3]|uniref:hypothetical protein n=1 Tax=Pedobacter sp. PF22-3 TaxID=2994467 RepID=UPI002247F553|nr:hypothetical protein [Pedobacter sp. PF22-3]MCX2493009.1 hypothetical protein [Pedobacter sp. PF22-3]
MDTHADKTQENKSQSVASTIAQKQKNVESTFQFVDNRPEAIAQKKLQEMANNHPRVMQLRTIQKMANNNKTQVKQFVDVIQRVAIKIEGYDGELDTKNPDSIWKYFYTIEDETKASELINALNEAGADDLSRDIEKETEAYFNTQPELDEYEQFELDYLETQDKNKKKSKVRKSQKKKPEKSEQDRMLEEYGGFTGNESTTDLNPIESLQEDVFSNLYQGGKETDFRHLPGQPNLKKLTEAKKFLESKGDRNYKKQLEMTRIQILEGNYLVRKMSKGESQSFRSSGGNKEKIFPAGTEGMKAFRIDESYEFKDSERNERKGDYDVIMLVRLSPKLKTYFINFLSANIRNPLGVQDKELQFGFNPQFKFENGGVTLLIPPSGWTQFWSFVINDISFKGG